MTVPHFPPQTVYSTLHVPDKIEPLCICEDGGAPGCPFHGIGAPVVVGRVTPLAVREFACERDAINDAVNNRLQAAVSAVQVAILESEWITTGDPQFPTLWHLGSDMFIEWQGVTPERREIAKKFAGVLAALITGTRSLLRDCCRCGAVKPLCRCCPDHRMDVAGRSDCSSCKDSVRRIEHA